MMGSPPPFVGQYQHLLAQIADGLEQLVEALHTTQQRQHQYLGAGVERLAKR